MGRTSFGRCNFFSPGSLGYPPAGFSNAILLSTSQMVTICHEPLQLTHPLAQVPQADGKFGNGERDPCS